MKVNKIIEEKGLLNLPVTYKGTDYSPITHEDVIGGIDKYLLENNFKIRGKEYLSAQNGQKAIGKVFLDYPDQECGFMVSWKNSMDGSMSFGLASGSYTFICANGSVYGDISSYKRKHSGNAAEEVEFQIKTACELMQEAMQVHIERRERMKEITLSNRMTAELCGRLFIEDEIISANQLSLLKKEMENPSFNYNSKDTAWEFYQHCTYVIKDTHPMNWHKVHKNLGNWFVNEFGLLVSDEQLVEYSEGIENIEELIEA